MIGFKKGIELSTQHYVTMHGVDDPLSVENMHNSYLERLKHDDDTHIAVVHQIKNRQGTYLTEWDFNIHKNVREYLHEELHYNCGRLPLANSLLPRLSLITAFDEMHRRLTMIGITNLEVCFDVMLIDQMILMGFIKKVVKSKIKAIYIQSADNNSGNHTKRIANIPIFLANIYSQIRMKYGYQYEVDVKENMFEKAIVDYGKDNAGLFMANFLKYVEAFECEKTL